MSARALVAPRHHMLRHFLLVDEGRFDPLTFESLDDVCVPRSLLSSLLALHHGRRLHVEEELFVQRTNCH